MRGAMESVRPRPAAQRLYRYVAGFAHEPDPADPNAVANHGNRMAERDALLPRLPAKSLKGVFAKTHLVTLLQLYKGGHLPDLVAWVATHRSSEEREELEDVLRYGIFMHVFPWEAVRDHPEDMKALMASDNFDHGHGLTDSELRCINGMREAILKLEVPRASSQGSASSQYDVVMAHVQRMSGQRWHEKDLECFWNFAQTTLDVHLAMLVEVWSFGECEDILQVDSAFFGALAKVSAKNQWSRCALAVRQFLSDKETECILVGGRYVAGAVDKNTLKRLAASNRNDKQKASSQELESFLGAIMQQYYLPWSNDWMRSPFQRDAWAKAFAAFLCKMGNLICRDTPPDHASKLKMETKLRETLNRDKLSEMPSRVVPDGVAPSVPNREGETVKAQDDLGSQASISSKRMAAECGLAMNGEVILKKNQARRQHCHRNDACGHRSIHPGPGRGSEMEGRPSHHAHASGSDAGTKTKGFQPRASKPDIGRLQMGRLQHRRQYEDVDAVDADYIIPALRLPKCCAQ